MARNFIAAVAVVFDRRVIDRDELKSLELINPHRVRIALEEQAKAMLAVLKRFV